MPDELEVKAKVTTTGVTDGLAAATSDIREFSEQAQGHLSGLTSAIGNIQAPVEAVTAGLGGLVGVIAGGAIAESVAKIAEAARELYEYGVEKPLNMAEAWAQLGTQMGLTAGQARTLEGGMKLSNTSQEQLSNWVNMGTRALKSNSAQLEAQGDAALTAAVKSGDFVTYLQAVDEHAQKMGDSIQRGEFLQLALGRSGATGQDQLHRFAEALGDGSEAAKQFGYDIGEGDIKNMEEFQREQGKLQLGVEGLELKLGRGLIPAFSQLLDVLADTGAFTMIGQAIVGTMMNINDLAEDVFEEELKWGAAMDFMGQAAIHGFAAVEMASHLDFSGARDEFNKLETYAKDRLTQLNSEIDASATKADEFDQKMMAGLSGSSGSEKLGTAQGNGKYNDTTNKSSNGQDAAIKEMMKANAEAAKEYEEAMLHQYRELEAAAEKGSDEHVAIVQAETLRILGMYGAQSKEYMHMEEELSKATREAAAAKVKAVQDASDLIIKTEEKSVADRMKLVRDQAQLGVISNQEELADLLRLENERYAVFVAESTREIGLSGLVESKRRELLDRQAAEEQKHADAITAIQGQAARASLDQWMRFFGPLGSQFQGMLNKWLAGTGHFSLSWKNVMGAMRQTGAQVVSEMATEWVEGEIKKTIATIIQNRIRQTTEKESAVQSVALSVWEGMKSIAISAYKAAAGAYSAISMIPIVGPVLAPIAAGVALAGVLALGSKLASAEGGYDIPYGVNPLVQAHQQEMILPKGPANVIRNLAEGGMGQAGGGLNGGHFHFHAHVHALDSNDVEGFFAQHGDKMAREMHRQFKNYNFGGKR